MRTAPWAALLAACGALQTLAFVHTFAWGLPLLGAALLAWAAARAAPTQAALFGWAYGSAWLGAGVWWLFISLHRYGGLAAPLAVAAVALLCAALALYLALAMAVFARWRSGRPFADALLFAALWLAAELARTVLFTGFPWLAAGYAQVDAPLAALAPWIGVAGIGAVAAFVSALLAACWLPRAPRAGPSPARPPWGSSKAAKPPWLERRQALAPAAACAGLLGACALAGAPDFGRSAGELRVTLLQTNVAQDEKFAAEHLPQTLAWLALALRDARGELVVAPETAIPLLPSQLQDLVPDYWPGVRERFEASAQAALIGVPLGDFDAGYTNSVFGVSAATRGAAPFRYDKVHLVPFGEFIPTGFRWFTEALNIPLGDFARGPLDAPSFTVGRQRIAPNICYEDLFGAELARRFRDAAAAPTVFANLSNIGWFGDTIAVEQHLNISRMRALEFQRPMLRATNTGATAIVDHRGQVTAQLPPFTRGVLDGQVQGREGLTPFAWWAARLGLWPYAAAVLAVLVAAGLRRRAPAAS